MVPQLGLLEFVSKLWRVVGELWQARINGAFRLAVLTLSEQLRGRDCSIASL